MNLDSHDLQAISGIFISLRAPLGLEGSVFVDLIWLYALQNCGRSIYSVDPDAISSQMSFSRTIPQTVPATALVFPPPFAPTPH